MLMWITYANEVTTPVTATKLKIKNGNSLCSNLFHFATTRLVKIVKENKLCLAFVKYVFSFGKYTAFCTSAQSPVEGFFFHAFI